MYHPTHPDHGATQLRKRTFSPTTELLEIRQLLASQIMQGLSSSVTATIPGGPNTTPQPTPQVNFSSSFSGSVGSEFMLQIADIATPSEWNSWAPYWLSKVVYTLPSGTLRSSSYDINTGSAPGQNTSVTHSFSLNGTYQDSLVGFFGPTVGTQTITVAVTYRSDPNGGYLPLPSTETYTVSVNVKAPTAYIDAAFPSSGTTSGFHFGPWQNNTYDINGNLINSNSPITWDDPGMRNAGASNPLGYSFGAQTPGVPFTNGSGVTFWGSATNTTDVHGCFSMIQYAWTDFTYQQTQMDPAGIVRQDFTASYHSPTDSKGNRIWGIDETVNNPQSGRFYAANPGDAVQLVNPYQNQNYVYYDNPRTIQDLNGSTFTYPTFYDYHLTVERAIVWTPDYGTPIIISTQPWRIDVHEDNATARTTPTYDNVMTKGNWIGYAQMQSYPPINNSPRMPRQYQYNLPNALNNAEYTSDGLQILGFNISGAAGSPKVVAVPDVTYNPPRNHKDRNRVSSVAIDHLAVHGDFPKSKLNVHHKATRWTSLREMA